MLDHQRKVLKFHPNHNGIREKLNQMDGN